MMKNKRPHEKAEVVILLLALFNFVIYNYFSGQFAGKNQEQANLLLVGNFSSLPQILVVLGGIFVLIRLLKGPLIFSLLGLICYGVLGRIEEQLWITDHHKEMVSVVWLGWFLGYGWWQRGVGLEENAGEHLPVTTALGLLGTAYCLAAVSKWVNGGPEWLMGNTTRLMVAEHAMNLPSWAGFLTDFRMWVVDHPLPNSILAKLSFLIELIGPLMLLRNQARRVVCLLLIVMHAGILIMVGIPYINPVIVMFFLGVLPDPKGVPKPIEI